MNDTNESEYIPPYRYPEFPPGSGQELLQSPEGWAYYIDADGEQSFLTPGQQPVSKYLEPIYRETITGRLYYAGSHGLDERDYIDERPVWHWKEGSTDLDARHLRPVVTLGGQHSQPATPHVDPYADVGKVAPPINPINDLLVISNAQLVQLTRIADEIMVSGRNQAHHLDRIATALEGILADLTMIGDTEPRG